MSDAEERSVAPEVVQQEEAETSNQKDETTTSKPEQQAAPPANDAAARFRALKARANLKATRQENHRNQTDPSQLASLSRKQADASQKLLKMELEEAGEDFERKRAWDWTVEESEKWDKRMDKKKRHRENVAFQDYTQDARKVYKRQVREMVPDVEDYARKRQEALDRAAESGDLELVEREDGEIVAVDKHGVFYSTIDSTEFVNNKPDQKAVDKLVNGLKKAEESRMKKRRERGQKEEGGDVTYINDKNKQFNLKLARFYNKYTSEIRDSFERGTMI